MIKPKKKKLELNNNKDEPLGIVQNLLVKKQQSRRVMESPITTKFTIIMGVCNVKFYLQFFFFRRCENIEGALRHINF